ncbi:MBG domain-containing protein [Galbibacter sp. PAP.153]|uniref:MBG domain-containing protein n=1 Tax=Galbibacter sp. PAP.153 TaxID=3104623 RepID=UPI00300BA2C9
MTIFVYSITLITGNRKFLSFVLFACFTWNAIAQTTYDFSTPPVLSSEGGTWVDKAVFTINGVEYSISNGINGDLTAPATGGKNNSACLRKQGASTETLLFKRVDNQPFYFYGFWLKGEGINSYDGSGGISLPPFYIINYHKAGGGTETYTDNTPMSSGAYTVYQNEITQHIEVTSISINLQANSDFWIDDISVSSDDDLPPLIASTTKGNVGCNGDNSGSASVVVVSGDPPYTYAWSPSGGTGSLATGLSAGTYTCTITDNSDRSIVKNFTITEPTVLSGSITKTDPTTEFVNDGTASVTATGGVPPYSYYWSPSGGTAPTATGLAGGTYTCTITDNNGCTTMENITLITPDNTPPSGYSVSMDLLGESLINSINESLIEFSGSGLEVGATLHYSFESDAGGSMVSGTRTVTSANQQFDNGGAGFDLSGLADGHITLTAYLSDPAGNHGADAVATGTKDAEAPSGYSSAWDDALVNATEAAVTSFTISGAEVGSTLNYVISSSGDGNTATITGNKLVGSSEETLTVDLSSLMDGHLTVTASLTDDSGNTGNVVTDNSAVLDQTAPNGYSVSIDQDPIDRSNQPAIGYTFAGAEAGATYNYTFSSGGGGTAVTGTGAISTATAQITGIDLSGLEDGTVTLSVTLEDPAGNVGSPVTDTSTKDTNEAPSVNNLSIVGPLTVGEALTAGYTFSDPDGDTESGTAYKWYRADDSSGSGKTAIAGAVSGQYALQNEDRGKYISFGVTPNDGIDLGATAESAPEGPVKVDQAIAFGAIAPKTYGAVPFTLGELQTDEGLTVTYTADDPSIVGISGNQATVLKAGATVITAAQNGDETTNVAVPVHRTLTVNPATLTVAAEGKSKVYGEADPTLTVSYSGFVSDDDEADLGGSLTVARATGEDAGTYAITASGKTSVNYTINYTTGELVITPATLTVSANAGQMKVYGAPDPELAYTVDGLVNNDTENVLTGALSRAPGEGAGSYPIDLGDLSAGDNYDIAFETSEFVIAKAAQEITWDQELNFSCDSGPEIALTATASSGLPVTYTVRDPSIAGVMAGVLHKKLSGSTLAMAHQPGDENHLPATSVEKRVLISQAGLIRRHWGDVLVFDNSSGDFVGYQWYKDGMAVPGATGQYYHENGPLDGSYRVTATTEGGAVITSCSLELSGEEFTKKVSILPNPVAANAAFVLESDFEGSLLNGATVSIIDLNGRALQTLPATGNRTRLGAPPQSGIYVVSLSLPNGERRTVNLLVR